MDTFPNGFTKTQVAGCITPRRLQLTILPTEKCNFRCTYCYEDFEHGRMRPEVVQGVCNLIARRAPGLSELSIQWFGGEPLLALPVVRTILGRVKELSAAHRFNVSGGFTTNGYLLSRDLLEELVQLDQHFFQITLDGWMDTHDSSRLRADGRGTFQRIWTNLLSFKDSRVDFEVQIRVHIRHDNHDSLRKLCAAIHSEFGDDNRFSVDFQDLRDLGGKGGASVEYISKDFSDNVRKSLAQLLYPSNERYQAAALLTGGIGESASSRPLAERLSPEPYICYASKPNQLLIRSTGRIGKCTVMLADDRNDIGRLRPDGSIQIDNEKFRLWIDGFSDMSEERLGCPAQHLEATNESLSLRGKRISVPVVVERT